MNKIKWNNERFRFGRNHRHARVAIPRRMQWRNVHAVSNHGGPALWRAILGDFFIVTDFIRYGSNNVVDVPFLRQRNCNFSWCETMTIVGQRCGNTHTHSCYNDRQEGKKRIYRVTNNENAVRPFTSLLLNVINITYWNRILERMSSAIKAEWNKNVHWSFSARRVRKCINKIEEKNINIISMCH